MAAKKEEKKHNNSNWLVAWEQFKLVIPLLVYVIVILSVISIYPIKNYWAIISIILTSSWAYKLVNDIRSRTAPVVKEYVKSIVKTGLYVSALYLLLWLLGPYGLSGLIFFILCYVSYRLWRGRKEYLDSMRTIERMTFGRTFDKKQKGD